MTTRACTSDLGSPALRDVLAAWPARRRVVAVVAAALLATALITSAPDVPALPAWWWATSGATSVLGAVVVESYVPAPGTGRRVEVGCTPCAAVAGLLAAVAVAGSLGSLEPGLAVLSCGLVVAAVHQRLDDAGSCPTPGTSGLPSAQDVRPREPGHRTT